MLGSNEINKIKNSLQLKLESLKESRVIDSYYKYEELFDEENEDGIDYLVEKDKISFWITNCGGIPYELVMIVPAPDDYYYDSNGRLNSIMCLVEDLDKAVNKFLSYIKSLNENKDQWLGFTKDEIKYLDEAIKILLQNKVIDSYQTIKEVYPNISQDELDNNGIKYLVKKDKKYCWVGESVSSGYGVIGNRCEAMVIPTLDYKVDGNFNSSICWLEYLDKAINNVLSLIK